MPNPLLALVLYGLWVLTLLIAVVVWRVRLTVRREFAVNKFPSGEQHGPDTYWRLNRAHANAAENLPIFGAMVVAGVLLEVASPWFGRLVWFVFGARVLHSLIHVSGSSPRIVMLRFSALCLQIAGLAAMAGTILLR